MPPSTNRVKNLLQFQKNLGIKRRDRYILKGSILSLNHASCSSLPFAQPASGTAEYDLDWGG